MKKGLMKNAYIKLDSKHGGYENVVFIMARTAYQLQKGSASSAWGMQNSNTLIQSVSVSLA